MIHSASSIPPSGHRTAAIRVFKDVSLKINQQISSWDFALGQEMMGRLIQFVRQERTEIGAHAFALELIQDDTASLTALLPKLILSTNRRELSLITVDRNLDVVRVTALDEVDEVSLSERSAGTVIFYYDGPSSARVYANRCTVGHVSLHNPARRPGRTGRYVRPSSDYIEAIRDHYRHRVRYWEIDHWEDRQNRVLRKSLGSASKTELIFHNPLFKWLEENIDDAMVISQPSLAGSDEPDIMITPLGAGKPLLVELKWLGSNGSTKYDKSRLRDGIDQLREYLEKQPTTEQAALVVYDGRSFEKFEELPCEENPEAGCRSIAQCLTAKLHSRGLCLLFFLESKTASE